MERAEDGATAGASSDRLALLPDRWCTLANKKQLISNNTCVFESGPRTSSTGATRRGLSSSSSTPSFLSSARVRLVS